MAAGLLHHCHARMTLFLYLKIMPSLGFPGVNTGSSRCAKGCVERGKWSRVWLITPSYF